MLAALFADSGNPKQPAILIFHGIGDRLEYWHGVQRFLASHEVASLIFDYSGYGESTGSTTPENLLQDAIATYSWLASRMEAKAPLFLLGFSLGTGLAVEVAPLLQPAPAGVILCQSYSSLRAAAARVVAPASFLARLMPDHWRTVDAISNLRLPLLIVHGDADRLFPVTMAEEIYAAATRGGNASVRLVKPAGYDHNAVYLGVSVDYWQPILEFVGVTTRPRVRLAARERGKG